MKINTIATIIVIPIIVVILGGVWYFYSSLDKNATPVTSHDQTTTSAGMRVEDNSVVITDQKPGNSVTISQVYLATPGYVVIHKADGTVIGSSALLPAGQNDNVLFSLNITTKNGDMFNAMLHNEKNGNTKFEESVDAPVQSRLGGPIQGMLMISNQASGNTPVSI